MTHKPSFSQAEFADKKKITRREKFLTRMETLIPWAKLLAVIEPFYPTGQRGRPPVGLERMLRIYFLQHWYGLADEALEDALYDSQALQEAAPFYRDVSFRQMALRPRPRCGGLLHGQYGLGRKSHMARGKGFPLGGTRRASRRPDRLHAAAARPDGDSLHERARHLEGGSQPRPAASGCEFPPRPRVRELAPTIGRGDIGPEEGAGQVSTGFSASALATQNSRVSGSSSAEWMFEVMPTNRFMRSRAFGVELP